MCNLNQTIIKNNLRKIGVYLGEKIHNRLTTFVLQNTKRNVLQSTFVFSKGNIKRCLLSKALATGAQLLNLTLKFVILQTPQS